MSETMKWQPIETFPRYGDGLYDVWSKRFGRIADVNFGRNTYGKPTEGLVYQDAYDCNGPVMCLIQDATHWIEVVGPEGEKK